MKAALKDYWLVWRYAMYYHKGHPGHGLNVVTRFFLLLLALFSPVLIALLMIMGSGKPAFSGATGFAYFAINLYCLLIFGHHWRKLLSGAIQYSQPLGIKLLPRIARSTFQITFWTWLVLATCAGLFWRGNGGEFISGFALFGSLLLWKEEIVLLFPRWMLPFATVSIFLPWLSKLSWVAAALSSQILGYAVSLLLVWITYHILRRVLLGKSPGSGASGRGVATPIVPQSTSESVPDIAALLAQVDQWLAPKLSDYERHLQADCTGRNTGALAAHSAGPNFYLPISLPMVNEIRDAFWPKHGGWLTIRIYAAIGAYWFYIVGGPIEYKEIPWRHTGWLVSAPLLLLWISELGTYPKALAAQIREQNLFRLSPLLPSPAMLNQHLAHHLLRNVLKDWLHYLAATLLLTLLLLAPVRSLLIQFSMFSLVLPLLASLPLVASRAKKIWLLPAVILMLVVLHWGLFMLLTEPFSNPLFASHSWLFESNWADVSWGDVLWHAGFSASNMLLAAIVLAIRWRAMVRAAPAFPVGRFGR